MINITTVYPCERCHEEISPELNFCSFCGQKQDLSNRIVYNLIYRQGLNNLFHMRYGGSPILTLQDMQELLSGYPAPHNHQCFVIGFLPSENPDNLAKLKAKHVYAVSGSHMSDTDYGETTFEISFLESR